MNDDVYGGPPVAIATEESSTKSSVKPEKTSRRWLLWFRRALMLSLLLRLGIGIALRFPSMPIVNRNANQTELLESLTVPVTRKPLAIRIEGNGTVISKDTVNLSPKTTGRLAELYVQQGDRVEAGQVVARMEIGSLDAELQQPKAQLDQAEADYARILEGNREEDILQA
ncbi:MAG: biotin/lipoyl-binding protein, partial [Leptolyngbya sp. SIO3F4]|nr:biotin/lipoyl-binding protein [Leptolyngbya sp. SIO3F4]